MAGLDIKLFSVCNCNSSQTFDGSSAVDLLIWLHVCVQFSSLLHHISIRPCFNITFFITFFLFFSIFFWEKNSNSPRWQNMLSLAVKLSSHLLVYTLYVIYIFLFQAVAIPQFYICCICVFMEYVTLWTMLHFCAYTVLLFLFCTVALLFDYLADQPQECEIKSL